MNIDELVEARVAQVLATRENVQNSVPRNIRSVPGTNNVQVTVQHGLDSHGKHSIEGFTRITRTIREETIVEETFAGP